MMIIDKILIWSHVAAGTLSLVTGLIAAFYTRKGSNLHRQLGKVYFWSMFWIFISALLIVSFIQFSFFLTIIAVFSFYLAYSGYRVLKLKKTMKPELIDWIASIIAMIVGASLFIYGVIMHTQSNFILGNLSTIFGFFTARTGLVNFNGFRKIHQQEKMWWWFAHMGSMSGSLIAAITAFLVQNGRIFGVSENLNWALWILPSIVGTPLIFYWVNKYRKQFKVGKYANAQ
jgi:uncharacterized membrane protein